MDAKDLRTETTQRCTDGSNKFAQSAAALPCSANKPYETMSSNPLSKVETPTSRPCAVIGPDRIVPPPPIGDAYQKKGQYEAWPPMDNTYRQPPEYPHKMPSYLSPLGNISPRQTFQENMPRIMVQPTYNSKVSDDTSYPLDRNLAITNKINGPAEPKYCDVPYTVNPINNDQKNAEMCVPNVNSTRNYPQMWHPPGVNMRPSRPYGAPEIYQFPDYASCAGPRPVPMPRPHRTINEVPEHVYSEPYYHENNVRYKPYPNVKERYQPGRYEYISNYPNPFHPPHPFPPPYKYDMQKSIPPHPTHPQLPMKYVDNRISDSVMDGYQRPPQGPYATPYRNQVIQPTYGPMLGNNLPNKMYPYPPEASVKPAQANKLPYDNKLYVDYESARNKGYPMSETYYDMRQHLKNQVIMPNYPPNVQNIHPHLYYRKENVPSKNFEYISHLRHMDPSLNSMTKMTSQFSPGSIAISPSDSNTSNDTTHTQGGSLEDCGYVSQSSNASIRSVDSGVNRVMHTDFHRRYGYAYPSTIRTSPLTSKPEINMSNSKNKKGINVRQFLQMWNEGDDESNNGNGSNPKEVIPQPDFNPNKPSHQYEVAKNNEQLYVLGLMNVPSEELGKYEHIQKVSKLPENIKGYNNIELLKHFEEAIESSNLPHVNSKQAIQRNYNPPARNALLQALPPRPLSPLDVEAKISQSVIHKEVGCNFEIKPCSPEMLNVQVATSAQTILNERTIEKVTNPLVIKSPMLSSGNENEMCHVMKQNDQAQILPENNKVQSCKLINTQCLNSDSTNAAKANYSLQDLEGNAGVCLASLPRLDNDIELNFPEVNQQFINANKESVITTAESHVVTNNDHHFNTIESGDDLENKNTPKIVFTSDSDKEFLKLSKYRKIKRNDCLATDKPLNSQCLRTDSVIIKNPENFKIVENMSESQFCEKKKDNIQLDVRTTVDHNSPGLIHKNKQEEVPNEIALDFSLNKMDSDNFDLSSKNENSKQLSDNDVCEDTNKVFEDVFSSNEMNILPLQNNAPVCSISPIIRLDKCSAEENGMSQMNNQEGTCKSDALPDSSEAYKKRDDNERAVSTYHILKNNSSPSNNSQMTILEESEAKNNNEDFKSTAHISDNIIAVEGNNSTSLNMNSDQAFTSSAHTPRNILYTEKNKSESRIFIPEVYENKDNNETEISSFNIPETTIDKIENKASSSITPKSQTEEQTIMQNDITHEMKAQLSGNLIDQPLNVKEINYSNDSCILTNKIIEEKVDDIDEKITDSMDTDVNNDRDISRTELEYKSENNDRPINEKEIKPKNPPENQEKDDENIKSIIPTNDGACETENVKISLNPVILEVKNYSDRTLESLDDCKVENEDGTSSKNLIVSCSQECSKSNNNESILERTTNTIVHSLETISCVGSNLCMDSNSGSIIADGRNSFDTDTDKNQTKKSSLEKTNEEITNSNFESSVMSDTTEINVKDCYEEKNNIHTSGLSPSEDENTLFDTTTISSVMDNVSKEDVNDYRTLHSVESVIEVCRENDLKECNKFRPKTKANVEKCFRQPDPDYKINNTQLNPIDAGLDTLINVKQETLLMKPSKTCISITEDSKIHNNASLRKELFSPWIQKLLTFNEGSTSISESSCCEIINTTDSNIASYSDIENPFCKSECETGLINTDNKLHERLSEITNAVETDVHLKTFSEDVYASNISSENDKRTTLNDEHNVNKDLLEDNSNHDVTNTADSGIYEIESETSIAEIAGVDKNESNLCMEILNNIECTEDSLEQTLNEMHADTPAPINTTSNEPITLKRSLKRSLSDSALASYRNDSEDFQKDGSLRPTKIRKNDNALLNVINIQNNRRNSISSIYNDENMAFCIVIGNNCIISEENEEDEKICYDITEQCFTTIQGECVNEDNVQPTDEVLLCPQDENCDYTAPLLLEVGDEKTFEESWVDDIACVETVVSDDIAEDIVISAPSSPGYLEESDDDESNIFNCVTEHTDKVKYIYGDNMCNDDAELVETLYRTPQMDVNKTLVNREHVTTDSEDYEQQADEDIISEAHKNSLDAPELEDCLDKYKAGEDTTEMYDNVNNCDETVNSPPALCLTPPNKIQDDIANICESSIDNTLLSFEQEENSINPTFSSPEVSSTTPEEKNSTILLKITNYKGMRISHISESNVHRNQNSCRFTENVNYAGYQNNSTEPRPLITKAAQKYIPPAKDISIDDLKVKLPLPRHSLMKYKQLKISRNERSSNAITKKDILKKPKPRFEDVLKSIDEIQFQMHKEKTKKPKKSVPKVVIKKNENGSHYASTQTKESFNPDLTGRKWQPWVFIEKNIFIDKMAVRKKTKAVYNHRKNTYVFADKFKKYKSIPSAKFVISQPKLDDTTSGQFKYTIRIKHSY